MKLALFFKGPIRPSAQECIENANRVKKSFESYDYDDFAFAWNCEEAHKFAASKTCKNVILLDEPDNDLVQNHILTQRGGGRGSGRGNSFKHFWMMKFAAETILKMPTRYDFIVFTRLDYQFEFLDIASWLNPSHYIAPPLNCDIMGSAPPELFLRAWDYRDVPTLNYLYGSSEHPEQTWQKIREMNGECYKPVICGGPMYPNPNPVGNTVNFFGVSHWQSDPERAIR